MVAVGFVVSHCIAAVWATVLLVLVCHQLYAEVINVRHRRQIGRIKRNVPFRKAVGYMKYLLHRINFICVVLVAVTTINPFNSNDIISPDANYFMSVVVHALILSGVITMSNVLIHSVVSIRAFDNAETNLMSRRYRQFTIFASWLLWAHAVAAGIIHIYVDRQLYSRGIFFFHAMVVQLIANIYVFYAYRRFRALLNSIRDNMAVLDVRASTSRLQAAQSDSTSAAQRVLARLKRFLIVGSILNFFAQIAEAASCAVMITDEDEDFVADPDDFNFGDVWVIFAWLAMVSAMVWYSWMPIDSTSEPKQPLSMDSTTGSTNDRKGI